MTRRTVRRLFASGMLLFACLLFGALYHYLERVIAAGQAGQVEAYGLHMTGSSSRSVGEQPKELTHLKTMTARLSLPRGGIARLFFGADETSEGFAFCLSLDPAIPSRFYRHPPYKITGPLDRALTETTRPVGTHDPAAVGEALAGLAALPKTFPDETYNSLDATARDRMAAELARNEAWLTCDLEIWRDGERLIASINGKRVATLSEGTARFVSGPHRATGVIFDRFPGGFLKSIALTGEGGYQASDQFPEPVSPIDRLLSILAGAGVGLLYWLMMTALLREAVAKNRQQVGPFEGMIVAMVGLPALLATGAGSGALVEILSGAILVLSHIVFIVGCGGFRFWACPTGSTENRHGLWLRGSAVLAGLLVIGLGGWAWLRASAPDPAATVADRVDQRIETEVILEEDEQGRAPVAEIYFRRRDERIHLRVTPVPTPPQWVAFRISGDKDAPTRFVTSYGPKRPVPDEPLILSPGRHTVRLEITGSRFVAFVDGKEVDRLTDDRFPFGQTGEVVRQGKVTFDPDPLNVTSTGYGRKRRLITLALKTGGPVMLVLGLLMMLLRRGRLALIGSLGFTLLLPALLALAVGPPKVGLSVGTALAALLLAGWVGQNRRAVRLWPLPLLLLIGLAGWAGNRGAGESQIGRSIVVNNRPGGYVTNGLYRYGTLCPEQVWPIYSGRFPFRGAIEPVTKAKPAGTVRILVLGGSSSWGFGLKIDETYPMQLQALLNPDPKEGEPVDGPHYQLLNAGLKGCTSAMGLQLLEQGLLDYQPDIVIFNFGYNDAALWAPSTHKDALAEQAAGWGPPPLKLWPIACQILVHAQSLQAPPTGMDKAMVPLDHFKETVHRLLELSRDPDPERGFKVILATEPFDTADGYTSGTVRRPYYAFLAEQAGPTVAYVDLHRLFREKLRPLDRLMLDRVHHRPCGEGVVARRLLDAVRALEAR